MTDKGSRSQSELVGRVHSLASLVEYSPGSIVSRAIIDKDVGTVTMFAFDKGEGLSEHTTPFDAMVQVVEGSMEIEIAGETQRVSGGDLLIMPANRPHALRAVVRSKMLLTMIRSR